MTKSALQVIGMLSAANKIMIRHQSGEPSKQRHCEWFDLCVLVRYYFDIHSKHFLCILFYRGCFSGIFLKVVSANYRSSSNIFTTDGPVNEFHFLHYIRENYFMAQNAQVMKPLHVISGTFLSASRRHSRCHRRFQYEIMRFNVRMGRLKNVMCLTGSEYYSVKFH